MCKGQKDFQNFLGVRVGRQKSLKEPVFQRLSQHWATPNYKLWAETIAYVAPQNYQQKHVSLNVEEAF